MQVEPFSDEYELVAPLFSVESSVLEERDSQNAQPIQRWFAHVDGQAVGAVTTWLRPDGRLLLLFKVEDVNAYRPLVDAAHEELGRSLSTMVDEDQSDRVAALLDCGFEVETVGERFRIQFLEVLDQIQRAWVPTGYEIRSVSTVDEQRALELDNAIRNLVPGSDGWLGDADWFHDELTSPEFDPDAYLIAIEQATDGYVGLIRIWRNPDGPRLGLIGVLPEHRSQPVAAALLKKALSAASQWGYGSFVTETSPSNRHTYSRITRLNPERLGRFLQLTSAWSEPRTKIWR